ncbi:MAG: ParA family protein [Thiohalobacteraceae bacterium]
MTFAAINEKGGSGRTTAFVNLAAGLAVRGKRVLLIDSDEQGHATIAFGYEKFAGLYDLMVRGAKWLDVAIPVDPERYGSLGLSNLHLLGSNVETRTIALNIDDAWLLAKRLAEVADLFDVCLIDTSPAPSLLHSAVFLAADYLICPTELEVLGLDGLHESIKRVQAVRAMHGKDLRVAGIIPNKCRLTTLEHRENLAQLRERFGAAVWPPIPLSIIWPEAMGFGRPVIVHAPDHEAAFSVWEMVDRVEALCNGSK